jgi:hypothetical protein
MCWFTDINLPRCPILSSLDLSVTSGGLAASPSLWTTGGIGLELPTLVVRLGVDGVAMFAGCLAGKVSTILLANSALAVATGVAGVDIGIEFGNKLSN